MYGVRCRCAGKRIHLPPHRHIVNRCRGRIRATRCARASVATQTDAAPALTSAWAAARAVAPVVKMSSTIKTCCAVTLARIGDQESSAHIHAGAGAG